MEGKGIRDAEYPSGSIHDMSWKCNFHSGMLNRRDRHIVDIYVQGLGFGCDMTALGYVSWECP